MPTLAEMMVGAALDSSDPHKINDTTKAFASGAAIAQQAEELKLRKAQIEEQKKQVYTQKIDKVAGMYETAAKLPPGQARNALFKSAIPKTVMALGLDKEFPPDTMELFKANPEVVSYLRSRVGKDMSLPDLLTNLQDPEWVAKQIPEAIRQKAGEDLQTAVTENLELLQEDERFRVKEENDMKAAQIAAGAKKDQRDIQNPMDLRKEVTSHPITKETQARASAYDSLRSALGGKASAAGDIAGVFAFMKAWDPTSTVRSDEQASATNAQGVPDIVRTTWNKMLNGERLSPAQRKDFVNQVEKLYRIQYQKQVSLNKEYEEIARATGIDPKLIFAGTRFKAPPPEKTEGKIHDVGGQKMTTEQAKAFFRASPQLLTPELKKELGL